MGERFLLKKLVGSSGGLWIIWKERKLLVDIVEDNPHWIATSVYSLSLNQIFMVIYVNGPIKTIEKEATWLDILDFMNMKKDSKFITGGEFNVILCNLEKIGGNIKVSQSVIDFRNIVDGLGLMDYQTSNKIFTWNNQQRDFLNIAEHLDMFLISPEWMDNLTFVGVKLLPISVLDNFSIKLDI
ncbi:hypothetical protein SUGI_0298220 [Cryptomeria japonica]|nr:hypothetical protein SUGI_0298220 [Cryptomeria japonica]